MLFTPPPRTLRRPDVYQKKTTQNKPHTISSAGPSVANAVVLWRTQLTAVTSWRNRVDNWAPRTNKHVGPIETVAPLEKSSDNLAKGDTPRIDESRGAIPQEAPGSPSTLAGHPQDFLVLRE